MDFVDALLDWLASNGYGQVGVTSFQGDMAGDTDNVCIALNEYNGTVYDTMGALLAVDQPMLQVAVRGKSFAEAKQVIKAIRLLLLGVTGQTINGVRFIRIAANGTVHNLERDQAGRQMFVANFEVWL